MREAGCSKSAIAKFKKLFANPDPQSLYAQNILADLEANRYAPESVERHIARMRDFREKCFSGPNIHSATSRKLTDIGLLWLQDNRLAVLPGEIGQLTNLEALDLSHNQLGDLPGEIAQLTNLQGLDLSHNRFAALPGEIAQLTNLQSLYLRENQLATLPHEIGQLVNLQHLKLNHNQIATLPHEIGQLINLQELELSDNRLAVLPEEIGQLTNLRRLWLKNNQFTTVPRALLDLPAETEIDLQDNPLPDAEIMAVREEINRHRARGQAVPQLILPAIGADGGDALRVAAAGNMMMRRFNLAAEKSFGPLTFLAQLESNMHEAGCSKELIAEFKTLFANPDPQSLYAQNILADLQANRYAPESVERHIARMDDFLGKCYPYLNARNYGRDATQLINLQTLYVQDKQLTSLPGEIGRLTNLRELNLRNNRLAALPGEIGQLTNLQTLNLKDNQFTALPGEIGQLTNLQSFVLNNNPLTALPSEIGQLANLNALCLGNSPLADLPGEIGRLINLQKLDIRYTQIAALPGEIGQLTNLNVLFLCNNQLAALPGEIGQLTNLQELQLGGNQLAALPGEIGQLTNLNALFLSSNQLADLPDEIGQLTNLRMLSLQNNQFTTVPRALLDLPATTEINLQDNPLPDAEIIAVREEINRRRAIGLAVPQLILPPLAAILPAIGADRDNVLRAAAAGDMNVHQQPLTDAFKRRLDELANQFPHHLKGTPEQQRDEIKTIETHLFDAFERHAKHHPRYRAARDVARTMFEKGYGGAAFYNEFRYSSGHVLSYVVLAMEAQWARTPPAQLKEAQENGLNNLIDFLAAGSGFCDTRHIEEVLQMIGIPLSQHAQVNSDTIGADPVGLSAEQIRDAAFPVAKRILHAIAWQTPGLADDALQVAFRTLLPLAMHAEHPGVTPEQLNAYLDTDILPMWDTFKELALENLLQAEEDYGSARSSFSTEGE